MFSVIPFLPAGEPAQVFVRGHRAQRGVVFGVDAVGLAIVRVCERSPSGWVAEPIPRVMFLPWSSVEAVHPLVGDEIGDDFLALYRVAGFCAEAAPPEQQSTERDMPAVQDNPFGDIMGHLMVSRAIATTQRWNEAHAEEPVPVEWAEEAARAFAAADATRDPAIALELQRRGLDFSERLPLALVEAIWQATDIPKE